MPVINQVELHPYFQRRDLRAFHEENGIATEGWSPLGRGSDLLAHPVIQEVAGECGRTPAQVVLRWHLDQGIVTIPKSLRPERIVENADLGFPLTQDQRARIDELDRPDGRIGPDPMTAEF
jgi:2,5-diketo-D-gluconate reductase A